MVSRMDSVTGDETVVPQCDETRIHVTRADAPSLVETNGERAATCVVKCRLAVLVVPPADASGI
jgi:hypothetical protein